MSKHIFHSATSEGRQVREQGRDCPPTAPWGESKQLEQAKQMLAAMSVSSYDYSITAPAEAGELDAHVTSERR